MGVVDFIFSKHLQTLFEENEQNFGKVSTVKPLCNEVVDETESEEGELKSEICYGEENSEDVNKEFNYGEKYYQINCY